jgi:hypothetical protein
MSGGAANGPFLPEDLFGLVLSFLLGDVQRAYVDYDRGEHGYILSLRLTSKAWREMIDAKCRVTVLFVRGDEGFHRRIPDRNTLPQFVLPSFRYKKGSLRDPPICAMEPTDLDSTEGMALFVRQYVPQRALTDRQNLRVLHHRGYGWREWTVSHWVPALEVFRFVSFGGRTDVSSLPNLRVLEYEDCYGRHVSHLNVHSLDKLEVLSITACSDTQLFMERMEHAPTTLARKTIHIEPSKTVRMLKWSDVDICNDARCWEWTRTIECVYLSFVPLTKISGPLQIVKLEINWCRRLLEIDIPEDAPTRHLMISNCENLHTIRVACRLHSLNVRNCKSLKSLDVRVLRHARVAISQCPSLEDVGTLYDDVYSIRSQM